MYGFGNTGVGAAAKSGCCGTMVYMPALPKIKNVKRRLQIQKPTIRIYDTLSIEKLIKLGVFLTNG